MKTTTFNVRNIFDTGLNYSMAFLWLPGTVFIIVSILTIAMHRMSPRQVAETWKATGKQTLGAAIAMVFGVGLGVPDAKLFHKQHWAR